MKAFYILITVGVALVAAGTYYYFQQQRVHQQLATVTLEQEVPEVSLPEVSDEDDAAEIKHPIPTLPELQEAQPNPKSEPREPLPALDESDEIMQEKLTGLTAPQRPDEVFVFKNFIQHLVVTVDNVPQKQLPSNYRPNKPPKGRFTVQTESEDVFFIDPKNYQRYTRYVQLAEMIDSRALVALYVRFYPLFQHAYEDLGYPSKYFNDRLIEVIDHLLDAPDVEGPIRLVRPHVFYKFAEPELEALSAGQKIMIRIGNDNSAKIKWKLRELRQVLTEQAETAESPQL